MKEEKYTEFEKFLFYLKIDQISTNDYDIY